MVADRIEREIDIEAPIERVWAPLTQAEHRGTWFGDAGATVDLQPGGAVALFWREMGTIRAVVEQVEPTRLFSFRWSKPRGCQAGGRQLDVGRVRDERIGLWHPSADDRERFEHTGR